MSMPSSVEILKSLEARGAALFVREMGFNQSFFEGDSEFVINSLRHGAISSSAFGHLIQDTLPLANSFFTEHSFFHSIRQNNVVAHVLTRREQDLFFCF